MGVTCQWIDLRIKYVLFAPRCINQRCIQQICQRRRTRWCPTVTGAFHEYVQRCIDHSIGEVLTICLHAAFIICKNERVTETTWMLSATVVS